MCMYGLYTGISMMYCWHEVLFEYVNWLLIYVALEKGKNEKHLHHKKIICENIMDNEWWCNTSFVMYPHWYYVCYIDIGLIDQNVYV